MPLVTFRDPHIGFGNRNGLAKSGPLLRPTTGRQSHGLSCLILAVRLGSIRFDVDQ
jgi:hypothetical protein